MDSQAAAFQGITGSGRYPAFAKLLGSFQPDGYELDFDELFELGLRPLLDGLAVIIEERAGPAGRPRPAAT
jgi:hypothetical protein